MSITGAGFRTWPVVSNRFSSDFGIEHFSQGSVKVVRSVDLVKRGDHLLDERGGQLQFGLGAWFDWKIPEHRPRCEPRGCSVAFGASGHRRWGRW